jgi:hypothetical protein
LGSGTNAPLYTTSFSAARPKAREEMEKHEGRLASALELDRVQRVLEFRESSMSPQQTTTTGKHKRTDIESKTVWKGTEWVMGGPSHSKFCFYFCMPALGTSNLVIKIWMLTSEQKP